jgi:hypothetical protein
VPAPWPTTVMRAPTSHRRWTLRRAGPPRPGTLVDYWYSPAVGHVIEALRVCVGYARGNPDAPVSLVLNGASPSELAGCCAAVDETFVVPFNDFGDTTASPGKALRGIPRTWEHVVHHPHSADPDHERFVGFWRYCAASRAHFVATRSSGIAGAEPPAYVPHCDLRLELPKASRAAAATLLGGRPTIAVLPAGSSRRQALYPSIASWETILDALRVRLPEHRICLIGRYDDGSSRTSSGITPEQVGRLLSAADNALVGDAIDAVDGFDQPLLDQLACIEASALLVSPHSGLGFAASTVGTPWLTISGGDWHETFFNGVPFHSLVPDTTRYPSYFRSRELLVIPEDEDGEGERTPAMSVARIREDLPELVEAAGLLVEGRVAYEDALAAYFPRLLEALGNRRELIQSFDGIHEEYV